MEIGEAFGRDRTTVLHACGVIEDMRDDPRFDDEVSELERQIEARLAEAVVL
jgi:chromosomal replication initiation ATPase DnaA